MTSPHAVAPAPARRAKGPTCAAAPVTVAVALTVTLAAGLMGGCATVPRTPAPHVEPPVAQNGTPPAVPRGPLLPEPPAPDSVPDAVPRVEPRSRYGNPPFYEVFGRRYYVLSSSADYVERGVASWYGPGFHKVNTSTQEPYDMYAMTAAHKTLPLPAYVRVTNLQNGRSVVVRVNDRGPFVGNRLIDLSYTAAAKLDMLRNGTALVEVRSIDPTAASPVGAVSPVVAASPVGAATPVAAPAAAAAPSLDAATRAVAAGPAVAEPRPALFVQAGAFADPKNADILVAKLQGGGYGKVFVRNDVIAGRRMYRVRIGPVPNVPEFDRIIAALEKVGVHDAHLAGE